MGNAAGNNHKGGAPLGNQNGAKPKLFIQTLRGIINNEALTLAEQKRRLYKSANKLLTLAANGEEWAVKMLAERLDGKPIQGVELAGPNGSAINFFDAATLRGMPPEKVQMLKTLLAEAGAATATQPDSGDA